MSSMLARRWIVSAVVLPGLLFAMMAAQPPPNDHLENRIRLTGTHIQTTGSNVGATLEPGEPEHADIPNGSSVWWGWVAPADGFVWVTTEGSGFDTVLGIYVGESIGDLFEVASNDDSGADWTSSAFFRVFGGNEYLIAVAGYGDGWWVEVEEGEIELKLIYYDSYPAPGWELLDVDGNQVRSGDFLGKVVILNFWATWCPPCLEEIPSFIELQNQYGTEGLEVIGISTDLEGAAIVRPFMEQWGINYQIVLADGAVRNAYGGINALPTTFIMDRRGNMVEHYVGYRSKQTFEAAILPLLADDLEVRLEVSGSAGKLALSWQLGLGNYAVEWTSDPAGGEWAYLEEQTEVVDGYRRVEIPAGESAQFFRLRRFW
jgi:thiol-disulfide isomerase/thioredoxin